MNGTRFRVEGMSCDHCEKKIKDSIGRLTGVDNVEVSLNQKTVTVNHDPSLISEQKLRETIEHEGYDVVS